MIVRATQRGMGLHVIVSVPEANCILAMLATGQPINAHQAQLREQLAREIGIVMHNDADYWRRYARANGQAAEAAGPQMGIVRLIDQARAHPELRPALKGVLEEATRKIDRLIASQRPRDASGRQAAGAKPWL